MKASDNDSVGAVVVGFDGGWRMPHLLRVAAEEATLRQTTLAVVMVSRAALDPGLSAGGRQAAEQRAEASAHRQLQRAAEAVLSRHHHLPVTTHHLSEESARAAAHPLSCAQVLVVGTIGPHSRRAFSPDSVSRILLNAARCPVLVVPHDVPVGSKAGQKPTVTVGIGDHPSDAAVIQAALTQSRRFGGDLDLVHAYRTRPDEDPAGSLRRAADLVARLVATADIPPDERCSVLLCDDDPAAALTRRAGAGGLLVIGSRPGSLCGLTRRSVAQDVIGSLRGPLLVVTELIPEPWSERAGARAGG